MSASEVVDLTPARVRRERTRALIAATAFTSVTELAVRFGISEVTVRSDLDALAGRGHIRRVRGGAVPRTSPTPERPLEVAQSTHAAEKAALGRAAAALVRSGETIVLDVGTTAVAVARALVARPDLGDVTVFTNGLTTALELEPAIPRFTVVVTGGTLRPLQHSLVDPLGATLLQGISADTVFVGCNGVDLQAGVTNVNLPEAAMKRRMLGAARRRVVLADGSKIGEVTLARLCEIDDVDLLLTTADADADIVRALREAGLDVQVAE